MILRSKFSSSIMTGVSLSLLAGSIPSALAGGWDQVNSPSRLGNFSPYFDETGTRVPKQSHVPDNMMPYADTYWPSNRGGIAGRWNQNSWIDPYLFDMAIHHQITLPSASEQAGMDTDAKTVLGELEQMSPYERSALVQSGSAVFHNHSPSREEALRMTRDQLAVLSPTEKYDLVRGKYGYPMTREVLGARNVGPFRAYWEGICHGWAPASINHSEPMPVDMTNPDGVVVPFGSADVKALLDYMYTSRSGISGFLHLSSQSGGAVSQMGTRCNTDLTVNPSAGGARCGGTNPGAFHIVMTNYIGMRHVPFVADIAHGKEIWNNPIYAYSFNVVDHSGPVAGSAAGTVRRVRIQTTIRVPSDDQRLPPQWNATIGTTEMLVPPNEGPLDPAPYANTYRYEEEKYEYWLELDASDNIIGGTWVSFDRPDYVWMMQKRQFVGDFEDLGRIYRPMFAR